ncbi:helix-turn-helix domain-containing protein [Teichococcus vastitatis]|uniref:Helix-turn-helix domain-containing protein n=1 Tax=Teichococcus vastitatis TaxID=2307076 RepID=A0ABS9W0Y5_9PROT|nr:helix-turn-helix domain-containing protein [Pseudoroseomonas vastitatis]MCI0752958.1 helix-turn-helix domain-containing protein [Pseudoroseomonas vastitatis]
MPHISSTVIATRADPAPAFMDPVRLPRVSPRSAPRLQGGPSPAIRRVVAFMELHFAERLTLPQLAERCQLSMHRFATVFRRQVGIPPHQYLCRVRARHARQLLHQGLSPAEAAAAAGFFDQSHLSRHFRRQFGISPARFAAACRAAQPRRTPPPSRPHPAGLPA